ncbi:MAG: hypothetical protein ABEL51_14560 [Salinibacter sp.]
MATASDSDVAPERARRVVQRLIDEQVAKRSDIFFMNTKHYDVRELGQKAADAFGDQKSQMNALEQTALNASTFGDIIDYVKSQLGRTTQAGDDWRSNDFGYDLHEELVAVGDQADGHAENLLESLSEGVCRALQKQGESTGEFEKRLRQELARRLRVRYAQAYIGHVVAHYNYVISRDLATV